MDGHISRVIQDGGPGTYVSVVVPFFTGLGELGLTLAGLANQSVPSDEFEVIVAEDGSPSTSEELIVSFPDLNLRRIWIPRRPYQLSTVRNLAIRAASGPLTILLDFDCIPLPTHIAVHRRLLESGPGCVSVGPRKFIDAGTLGRADILGDRAWWESLEDVPSISNGGRRMDKRLDDLPGIAGHPFPCNLFHGCNVGFWRVPALEVGLFDERFNGAHGYEDIEFAYRMQRGGARFAHADLPVLHQENEVVDRAARQAGRIRNYALLRELAPELVAFREQLSSFD